MTKITRNIIVIVHIFAVLSVQGYEQINNGHEIEYSQEFTRDTPNRPLRSPQLDGVGDTLGGALGGEGEGGVLGGAVGDVLGGGGAADAVDDADPDSVVEVLGLANVGLINEEESQDGFDTHHKDPVNVDAITGSRHFNFNVTGNDTETTFTQRKSLIDIGAGLGGKPDKITIKHIPDEKEKLMKEIKYPPLKYRPPPHLFGLKPFKPQPEGTCTNYYRCKPLPYNSSFETVASPFLYGTQYASGGAMSVLVFSDNSYAPGQLLPEFDTENYNDYLKEFHDELIYHCPVIDGSGGYNMDIANDQTAVYKLESVPCEVFYTAIRMAEIQRDKYNTLVYGGFTLNVDDVAGDYFFKTAISKDDAKQLIETENVHILYKILVDKYGNGEKFAVFSLKQNITSLCTHEKVRCKPLQCSNSSYYTFDGTCNTQANSIVGKSPSSMIRLGRPFCAQGGETECNLPNPRIVSLSLGFISNFITYPKEAYYAQTPDSPEYPSTLSLFSLFAFQFVMHDTTRFSRQGVLGQNAGGIRSCTRSGKHLSPELKHPSSDPIDISCNDPYYSKANVTCLNFNRGQLYNGDCTITDANFVNFVSSYLDMDQIYLRDECKITDYIAPGGKIKDDIEGFPYLGDSRAFQSAPLIVVHALYALLHNKLAEKVKLLHPDLTDYEIFQKARMANIYIYQYFVDHHLLPNILGKEYSTYQGINSDDSCYDRKLDPSTLMEFSCAIGRSCHIHLPDKFFVLHHDYSVKTIKHLNDDYGGAETAFHDFAHVFRGLTFQTINVLGHAFEAQNEGCKGKNKYGIDLFAYDIKRGRNCCLQPYIYYVKKFFAVVIKTWDDLAQYIPQEAVMQLRRIYTHVGQVELYTGLSTEKKYEEGLYGPVGRKIVTEQYLHYKCSDAKHYSNVLSESAKACLADIDFNLLLAKLAGVNTFTKDIFIAASSNKEVFTIPTNSTPFLGLDCLLGSLNDPTPV